uniref:Uncharacterized protein n=1 Tax=Arundo donax TaxID=35708 RepID=A0A0A9H8P9_ARUDO
MVYIHRQAACFYVLLQLFHPS